MKVLQVNCSAGGSTGNIAREIHAELINQGHESYFAYGRGSSNEVGLFKITSELDYRFHTYFSRLTGLHGYYSSLATKRLIKQMDDMQPDIIHLHNLHGGYVNIKMLLRYLKRKNKHVVITLHDCWLFTGGCAHYTMENCYKWQHKCGGCTQLKTYPKSILFDTSKKCLRDKQKWLTGFGNLRIVTVSKWLAQQASMSFLKEYPISTIYSGVNLQTFHPVVSDVYEKYSIQSDKPIIMGAANVWSSNKRLDLFVRLAECLRDKACVLVVGLSQQQISSLPANMIGITRTENQAELVKLYTAASLFINFSAEETLGMVTIEAMACGTPAMVTNTTACPETVYADTGYVVDPEDFEAVLAVVQSHLTPDPITRDACVNRVSTHFSATEMAKEYIQLYQRLID